MKSIKIDGNKPIDWNAVLKNAEKHAKEQFGRPDVWTQDTLRAWQALVEWGKKGFK